MPLTTFVSANGARIPVIGLGTWPMQGEECAAAVAAALKAGYRHIDTAAMYGNEEAVGDGLKRGGVPRGDIWVTTKVWADDIRDGDLQRSAETSLKKLGLDRVDLLLIHWPNKAVPLKESIGALNDAKRRGLASHIGISNFPTRLIEDAVAVTQEPLVCNQVEYHPHLDQSKVLAACRRHEMALVAYCPLGRGAVGGVLDEPAIKEIAAAKGRTPGQVVLRWLVQQPGVVAVPKSANPKRIAENLDVFSFTLSDADMARISALARPDGRVVNPDMAPDWD
ncbi:MAG: aldo/keto reductase [Hyphomicrobiaceae bacterium]|jgi:diketogulonate reductase-like aldo/keto reductase